MSKDLLELTHISPRPKTTSDNKIEELLLKSEVFKTKLEQYKNLGISQVVIEEPLLNSNNVYTISTLMRYNTLITKQIYDTLGIIPDFISTYNSRKFAFPELVQENEKKKFVLFGGSQKIVTKNKLFGKKSPKLEPQITWSYTKNNTLKKENFDMTDAYCCVLGYMKGKDVW